jgi:hypothetical protein
MEMMLMPIGRILLKSISDSNKLPKLKTDGARLLYTWLIAHLDINGCFYGDAQVVKGKIFTRLNKSIKTIDDYLKDLEENKLILRYRIDGDTFLNVPDFKEKQPSLNPAKEGKPTIPLPTPELLQSYSRVTPAEVNISKVNINKDNINQNKGGLSEEEKANYRNGMDSEREWNRLKEKKENNDISDVVDIKHAIKKTLGKE